MPIRYASPLARARTRSQWTMSDFNIGIFESKNFTSWNSHVARTAKDHSIIKFQEVHLKNDTLLKSTQSHDSASWKITPPLFLLGCKPRRWWASIIFSAFHHTVCQRKPIYYKISGLNIPLSFFAGIAYLKGETRPNQGAPINLVRIYFYFDLSPWLFKGYCMPYWFRFLSCQWQTEAFYESSGYLIGIEFTDQRWKGFLPFITLMGFILATQVFSFDSQIRARYPQWYSLARPARMPKYGGSSSYFMPKNCAFYFALKNGYLTFLIFSFIICKMMVTGVVFANKMLWISSRRLQVKCSAFHVA